MYIFTQFSLWLQCILFNKHLSIYLSIFLGKIVLMVCNQNNSRLTNNGIVAANSKAIKLIISMQFYHFKLQVKFDGRNTLWISTKF